MANNENTITMVEVEQKFRFSSSGKTKTLIPIYDKLTELGFIKEKKDVVRFVDVYIDLPSPNEMLCVNDFWLRYRYIPAEEKACGYNDNDENDIVADAYLRRPVCVKGSWQLKRRPYKIDQQEQTQTAAQEQQNLSVYEELEDEEAIRATFDFLSSTKAPVAKKKKKEKYIDSCYSFLPKEAMMMNENGGSNPPSSSTAALIKKLLGEYGLTPFSVFETKRSSWIKQPEVALATGTKTKEENVPVRVDLDETDFGYSVGEVEMIVPSNHEIELAKETIQKIVDELTREENTADDSVDAVYGKLETYLMKNKPSLYEKCVQKGVL